MQIGSETYPISTIIVPDDSWSKFIETSDLSPIRGAKVTIFNSQKHSGPQAILGAQTEDDIDALYRRRSGRIYGLIAMLLGVVSMAGGISVLLLR